MSTAILKSDSTTGKSRDFRRDLLSDESGATMVIGVFMAAMLVGFLYYLHGTANVIIHRDRLQDAADSGAFAAAVIQARAMNIISICNVLMSIFAIIGTIWRVAADIITAAAVTACAIAAASEGWDFHADYYCIVHGIDAVDAHGDADDMYDTMDNLTSAVHMVVSFVRTAVPVAAELRVITWGDEYSPTVGFGFMISDTVANLSLPIEEDDTNWPCDNKVRYIPMAGGPVLAAFKTDVTEYLAAGIVETFWWDATWRSHRWCGDDRDNFQRIPPDDDHWLGAKAFQDVAVMEGEQRFRWTEQGVAVAGWSNEGSNLSDDLEFLDDVSFAQAEFYFEETGGGEIREEWVWHCNWRARMRRVNMEDVPLVGDIPGIDMVGGLIAH